MTETWSTHLTIIISILVPLGSGIAWLIRGQLAAARAQARMELKVDTMWLWFTNHGSDITGYGKEQK